MRDGVVPVVTVDWEPVDGEKGVFGRTREAVARVSEIGVEQLAGSVDSLCRYVGAVFANAAAQTEGLELKQLEVTAEISASGELRLIGAVNTQVKGGIKLVFTKPDPV